MVLIIVSKNTQENKSNSKSLKGEKSRRRLKISIITKLVLVRNPLRKMIFQSSAHITLVL